ncbi:hypothetical protein C1646_790310 [Rhizophagus diaphanus]|nr:hypothetical protein C1646_790310 [Rhizophagus diaphanus] [Rhizophagus sp. MUCL 43196]
MDNLTELENYKNLYELYKSKYDSVLNHNAKLQNELQKYSNPGLVMPENTCPVSVGFVEDEVNDSQPANTANSDSISEESTSEFLVLKLNFAGLRTSETYVIFQVDFYESLNTDISKFMYRYKQELGSHFQVIDKNKSALTNFKELLNTVELSGNKLYVFIDECNASMNEALKNETLLRALNSHHKSESDSTKSRLESIESSFKQFFSRLKTACDEGVSRVFLTGVTPVVMAEFTSGFNISVDLALKKEFWDLYGFKKSEIEFLLDSFGNNLSDYIKEKIMQWLKNENDGYFFHRNQSEGIFNTARACTV